MDRIKVAIYGYSWYSVKTKFLFEKYINTIISKNNTVIEIKAFITLDEKKGTFENLQLIDFGDFIMMYERGEIDALLLPSPVYLEQWSIISFLLSNGFDLNNVYLVSKSLLEKQKYELTDILGALKTYYDAPSLSYLEYHVADHCNLNCSGCEHYSPLVKDEVFTDIDSFKNDITKLKEFIYEIGRIRILGGEPLLHKDIYSFMQITREMYPKSDIYIVTNALLIKQHGRELIDNLLKYDIRLDISFYPPLENNMSDIIQYLKDNSIEYSISPLIKEFTYKQRLDGVEDKKKAFYRCVQAQCNNLYRGRIAACFLPFTTHYFNEAFGTEIPESGALNLYEEGLTTAQIKKFLVTPFERCTYCGEPILKKWKKANIQPDLEDWIV